MGNAYETLIATIKHLTDGAKLPDTPVSISVDEVHNICIPELYGRTPYDELCSVMGDLVDQSFGAIFLSTSSRLSRLAPAAPVHPSDRGQNPHTVYHSPPLCELPFDAFQISDGSILENSLSRDQILHPKIFLSFGRPLSVFSSMLLFT